MLWTCFQVFLFLFIELSDILWYFDKFTPPFPLKVWFFCHPFWICPECPNEHLCQFWCLYAKVHKQFPMPPTIHDFHLFITSSSSCHGFNTPELIQRPAPCRLVSSIGRALHRYRRGFLFATAKVASIIAMIFFHIKNKQLCIVGEVSLNIHCRTVVFIFKVCRLSKAVSSTNYVENKRREKRK